MQLHTSELWMRLAGTATGIGYLAVGAFAVVMSHQAPDAQLADRSLWMGLTFLIGGISAIAVSWLVRDLTNIWCRPPPRRLDD